MGGCHRYWETSCFQLQYKLQRPQCLRYQIVTYKPCFCENNITLEIMQYERPSTRFKKHQIVISFETGFHIKLPLDKLQDLTINRHTKFWYFADRASQYIYLNINQLDALNFIMSLFHASTCFEHMRSSSGGQNCTIQRLVSSHL